MQVILISGYQNSGKTTTCKLLKEKILDQGGKVIADNLSAVGNEENEVEVQAILELDGKIYGISSIGDNAEQVKKGCDFILEKNNQYPVDYFFFTSRSKGACHHTAIDFAKEHDSAFFEFFANNIQPNIDGFKIDHLTLEAQKQNYLDYILNAAKIPL